MPRFWPKTVLTALMCLMPVVSGAQGRTAGQIVGTVKDASGAVVPKAELILIDNGTGTTTETTSGADGGFVFPNLQPGRYQITATFQGFNPVTIQEVVVETSRSVNLVVQFEVAGLTEQVRVEGRSQVVETTSTTIANTVSNEQISKLPLAGRNILGFALLVPGAATSATARDSEYNGLPGGAINITLDGVNNNSARFRSGGTSMFVFAPIRLGAIEEVTVSTAGLTADAGAEGAVQIQFVTKRGSNAFRGQVFDTIQSDKLNAQGAVNKSRAHSEDQAAPARVGRELRWSAHQEQAVLFRQLRAGLRAERIDPGTDGVDARGAAGHLPLHRHRQHGADGEPARHRPCQRARRARSIRTSRRRSRRSTARSPRAISRPSNLLQDTFRFINPQLPNDNIYPTTRVDYQATQNLAIRGVLNLHWRDLPRNPQYPGSRGHQCRVHVDLLHSVDRRGLDAATEPVLPGELRRAEQLRRIQPREYPRGLRRARRIHRQPAADDVAETHGQRPADSAQQPGLEHHQHADVAEGETYVDVRRHVPPDHDVRIHRGSAAGDHVGRRHGRPGIERLHGHDNSWSQDRGSPDGAVALCADDGAHQHRRRNLPT